MALGPRPGSWQAPRVALLCVAGSAAAFAGGCGPECGEAQTIRYDEGITDDAGTFYQSTLITGPLLHFPSQRKYELVHHLSGIPKDVHVSLSFQEVGSPDKPLSLSPATGNEAIWSVDAAAGTIEVRNDVCGEFYIYVTAQTAPDGG